MCRFKSGIILKNKVVLAPEGNESHSNLLKSLGIADTNMNAMKKFIRAELIPKDGNKTADISEWEYVVDQDIVPDWYEKDPDKYEKEFRTTVEEWIKERFAFICGELCIPFKTDEKGTYYLLAEELFSSDFGKNNNYEKSKIREKLLASDFAKELKKTYGESLVPVTIDLLSLDGLDDYGVVKGDDLGLLSLDLYRENRKRIPNLDKWWWLATPNSTPSGCCSDSVRCVNSSGCVSYGWYNFCVAVRPFFILKSSISVSCDNTTV